MMEVTTLDLLVIGAYLLVVLGVVIMGFNLLS